MENKAITKQLSVGTIITDGQYILGCRPYGRKEAKYSYDLPKGHLEEGETYIETAVRECKEETGFDLWPDHLVSLGNFQYIPTKDLYLFLVAVDFLPEHSTLKCTSYFEVNGKSVPEVIGYKNIPITELQWFFRSLEPLVKKALEIFDNKIEEDEDLIIALPESEKNNE
jgi:8-oxo-dGTP pyrophosphatase MutT (NUDIX family)